MVQVWNAMFVSRCKSLPSAPRNVGLLYDPWADTLQRLADLAETTCSIPDEYSMHECNTNRQAEGKGHNNNNMHAFIL